MPSRITRRCLRAIVVSSIAVAPTSARAEVSWIGGSLTSDNWSDHLNWGSGDRPDDGDSVRFEGVPARKSPNVNQDYSINNLIFSNLGAIGSSSFTVNGSGTLSLFGDVDNFTSKSQVVNASIVFKNAGTISNNASNGNYGRLGVNFVDTAGHDVTIQPSDAGISMGGEIAGSGDLYIDGSGTVEVGGSNSWTGDLYLKRGTFSYSVGPSLGGLEKQIRFEPYGGYTPTLRRTVSGTTATTLYFDSGESRIAIPAGVAVTHSSYVGGSGSFAKTEGGTLRLTGDWSEFDGRVYVREGTLQVGGTTLLPDRELEITGGATLEYDDGKSDAVRSLSGSGTLSLGTGSAFVAGLENFPGDTTFNGVITGSNSSFAKTGTGFLNLTGNSTLSGTTRVSQGTLLANNMFEAVSATGSSAVTVETGAFLGGDGVIAGSVELLQGAHLAPSSATVPGSGIGGLQVGMLSARQLSTVDIEFNAAGQFDSVNVTGIAITDGTLNLQPLANGDLAAGQSRAILFAEGGRGGTFRAVSGVQLSATKSFAVTYNAQGILVTAAHPGDATLDGKVDFQDLIRLAQNYEDLANIKTWSIGDFTGDGKSQFADLVVLAQNYGFGGVIDGDAGTFGSNFAADWALAQSMVPEPTAVAGIAAAITLFRRRR
jgi:autotransporter-associated beta strand protein